MATEVVMPRLSDTMDSGTIAKWLKQEGDQVKKGDILAEIETDKANMELESYASGVLAQISVGEGQSAGVGEPIAVIAASAEEADSLRSGGSDGQAQKQTAAAPSRATPDASGTATSGGSQTSATASSAGSQGSGSSSGGAQSQGAGTTQTEERPSPNGQRDQSAPTQLGPGVAPQVGRTEPQERVKASPLARRLAQEHGIDLASVGGTGPGGRITKEDVQSFLKQAAPIGEAEQAAASTLAPEAPQRAEAPPTAQPTPAGAGAGRESRQAEMSRMRQTIARRMTQARFGAPDFLLTAEFDMTEARALLKRIAAVDGAPKVGPNDLLVKAAASALTQHPQANAGWENDGIMLYGRINVGIAVAVQGGLIVPVVQDADKKSLGTISSEAKALIEKARANKLAPSDYESGTFTISNLGMYGIDQFTSILNPPEACSLAVGAIAPKPVVIDGEVVVRDRMRVTLTCDHRVINGAEGAEFLQTLRRLVENPMLVVL